MHTNTNCWYKTPAKQQFVQSEFLLIIFKELLKRHNIKNKKNIMRETKGFKKYVSLTKKADRERRKVYFA